MKKSIIPFLLAAAMLTACGSSDSESSSQAAQNTSAADSQQTAESTAEESSQAEPAEPRSIKLMALGDSITEGFTYKGAYRESLANLLEENGLSEYVDFVGKKTGGDCYDNQHCGYTGYSIDRFAAGQAGIETDARSGISSNVDKLMSDYTPDVVMLQIGTNDILSLYELDTAGDRLAALVDKILAALPEDGMLYLATIPYMDANDNTYISAEHFTVESMDKYVDDYNEKVKALAEKLKSEGKPVELADVNSAVSKEDLQDGVHPTKEGYAKLGEFWYGIISGFVTGGAQ